MVAPVIPILAKLAVSLGPTILRRLARDKGGTTEVVANTVAEVMESVLGQPQTEQSTVIANTLRGLPADQIQALGAVQVELERIKQEGSWRELENELELVKGDTAARVAELHQSDLYTKQTRPKIARQSWYVSAAYSIGGNVFDALQSASIFQWEVFVALSSPAMLYMGVRGLEKWRSGGARK